MLKTSRWLIGRDNGLLASFPLCSNFQLLALSLGQATAILWTPVSTGWSSTSDAFLSPSLSSPSSSPKQSLSEIFNLEAQKKTKRPSHLRRTTPHPTSHPEHCPSHAGMSLLPLPACTAEPSAEPQRVPALMDFPTTSSHSHPATWDPRLPVSQRSLLKHRVTSFRAHGRIEGILGHAFFFTLN